jgi:hypothetical protein
MGSYTDGAQINMVKWELNLRSVCKCMKLSTLLLKLSEKAMMIKKLKISISAIALYSLSCKMENYGGQV